MLRSAPMDSPVPIDKVPPGSILDAAVLDARGNVLVGEGRVLTEEWLKRLQGRGITHVRIRAAGSAASPGGGQAPEAGIDKRLQRLDAMFAKAPQEPLMLALAAAARQVLSERRP